MILGGTTVVVVGLHNYAGFCRWHRYNAYRIAMVVEVYELMIAAILYNDVGREAMARQQ